MIITKILLFTSIFIMVCLGMFLLYLLVHLVIGMNALHHISIAKELSNIILDDCNRCLEIAEKVENNQLDSVSKEDIDYFNNWDNRVPALKKERVKAWNKYVKFNNLAYKLQFDLFEKIINGEDYETCRNKLEEYESEEV